MSHRYGWSKVACVCYKRWCCFWYDYEPYSEFSTLDRSDFLVNHNPLDPFTFTGVGRTDSIAWNAVVAVSIEPLSRDTEGVGSKEILCPGCDEYLLSSNNGIGSSSKEVLSTLTWGKGKRVLYKTLFVTNSWLLPMLGRDLHLRTHFVRFLEWEDCLVTLKWRHALFRYMHWSCAMIWLHNWPCYSCTGQTVCKRRSCLIISDLFPSQGINSWLSESTAQDQRMHYILPSGFKYQTKVLLGDVGIRVLLSKPPHQSPTCACCSKWVVFFNSAKI